MRTPKPWILPTQPTGRAMLVARGITDEMIETQLRAGRLRRVRQGVYLSESSWPADEAGQHLVRARAEQVMAPGAVLSHQTAALVWHLPTPGIRAWHDYSPSITLDDGAGHRSRRGPVVRHVTTLQPADIARDDDGYDVTSVARTAVDLADGLTLPDALVILDGAGRLAHRVPCTCPACRSRSSKRRSPHRGGRSSPTCTGRTPASSGSATGR